MALSLTARSLAALPFLFLLHACATTSHPLAPAKLGAPRTTAQLLEMVDQPGPVLLETVNAADWEVPLGGLVNLDHPTARAAHLTDHPEPIQVFFHALRHPQQGLWIIDTGVEKALRDDPGAAAIRGLVASVMHVDRMQIHAPLAEWLSRAGAPLQGVLLTHLHPDHITGLADAPASAQVIGGPGEGRGRAFVNLLLQANVDRTLDGKGPLQEWAFEEEKGAGREGALRFDGVLDVFGDATVFALWVPGHTPGSTAYLVRTPQGPVLLTGDCSHTRWGWDNGVEPGSYTEDHQRNALSLGKLKQLVALHPKIEVRLGHQR
jgi:N-acyl homoserine lactone hydrolase